MDGLVLSVSQDRLQVLFFALSVCNWSRAKLRSADILFVVVALDSCHHVRLHNGSIHSWDPRVRVELKITDVRVVSPTRPRSRLAFHHQSHLVSGTPLSLDHLLDNFLIDYDLRLVDLRHDSELRLHVDIFAKLGLEHAASILPLSRVGAKLRRLRLQWKPPLERSIAL